MKAPSIVRPTCGRHSKPQKDVKFRHFFRCDPCSAKRIQEAISGNVPLDSGEAVNRYCLLCNRAPAVRIINLSIFKVFNKVVASIGRNHVAEQAIVDF